MQTEDTAVYYCTVCRSYVEKSSKHCGQCDRCIHGFDHHCKWLNNCIGLTNYKNFIVLLITVLVYELVLVVYESVLSKALRGFRFWVVLVDLIGNAWIFLVIAYLLGFHVYLKFANMTTYEYLRRRSREVVSIVTVEMNSEQSTKEKSHAKSKSEDKGGLFERENFFRVRVGNSAS